MRRGRIVAVVGVAVMVVVAVGMGVSHKKCYIITLPKSTAPPPQGFPTAIDSAAARKGNGSDTAARNQTNFAGMKGISHRISR